VIEDDAVVCTLQAGQASFHHGWTLHSSAPNHSDDRRIGLNVQYLATHVSQTRRESDTAILVRGEDAYHHFAENISARSNLEPVAVSRQKDLQDHYRKISGTA
jgi:ectoine hydroxylase-related dioxygenase (phytanoyl-CoA dioxygenase family)